MRGEGWEDFCQLHDVFSSIKAVLDYWGGGGGGGGAAGGGGVIAQPPNNPPPPQSKI